MAFDSTARHEHLRRVAPDYLNLAIDNITREYPNTPWMIVNAPGPLPSHRDLHPTFFGSFDWHSCVEMYWVAVRMLRLFPNDTTHESARAAIRDLLTPEHIALEADFFTHSDNRSFERPYGWGWALALQHELDSWDDPDGQLWADTLRPLSDVIVSGFIGWLPLLTYPQRIGMHSNTAFGLLRSLDYASSLADRGDPTLLGAIVDASTRFFAEDTDYPARYEPSGADFLSAALAEAELMSRVLPRPKFSTWLDRFLPGIGQGSPSSLFTPAIVSDISDGQIAHLAGLNLSRGASFLALAAVLGADDPRVAILTEAARIHGDASLGDVTGSHYMAEHWLSAYATLLLTA